MEASRATDVTVIEPSKGWHLPGFGEVWSYRDLLYFLARREVVIRYKQAAVGALWAILQPLLLAGMFALFLGVLAKIDSPTIPYPLLAVSGLVIWIPFSRALELCTLSTVTYEALITKIHLPRLSLPVSSVASAALDMVIGCGVGIAIAAGYGYFPSFHLVILPFLIVLSIGIALGIGLFLSALNVKYRDIALAVPSVMLAGLFITPITYPFETFLSTAPHWVEPIYALNPMVGVLEMFRWGILGTEWPGLLLCVVPIVECVVFLIAGALYYERAQSTFADVI